MKRFILALVLGVWALGIQAATIRYVVEGDLIHNTSGPSNGSDEAYDLAGAHYVWTALVDADKPPDQIGNNQYAYYWADSSFITFTNRPNGAPDIVVDTSVAQFRTINHLDGDSTAPYDGFAIRNSYLTSEFSPLVITSFNVYFPMNFYNSESIAPLPQNFEFSDILVSYWGRIDGSIGYENWRYDTDPNTWTMSAQLVPIPAAAWLFGSALGLLGWMRRRIS